MPSTIMPKPLLFLDFDGVLCYDRFWFSFGPERQKEVADYLFRDNQEIARQWMRGKYTSESIHQMISAELGFSFDELFALFRRDCENFFLSPLLTEAVRQLKSKYTIILRTDNMDSLDRFTLPAHPEFTALFDQIDNSFNLGSLKLDPDHRYYENIIHASGAPARTAVLIDNSSRVCELFDTSGGTSFCVTGEEKVTAVLHALRTR